MRALTARPRRTANSTARRLTTGNTPGIPTHTGHTWVFGAEPKVVEHPQNILERVSSWAWTSSPITVSYTVVAAVVVMPGSSDRSLPRLPLGGALVSGCRAQNRGFRERLTDHLEADRQAVRRKPARQRHRGHTRQVDGNREDIREVHLQRVLRLFADSERGRGRGRRDDHVHPLEGSIEVSLDQRAHALRLGIVRFIVTRGQRVRPQHDPAFHLRA